MQRSRSRQTVLEQLIEHALAAIRDDDEAQWLQLILRRGFVGFENMPESQLHKELELRGLTGRASPDEEPEPDEIEDDWDVRREVGGLWPGGTPEPA
jgi:hypothetical protein